jgi:hypothetical protein
MFPTEVQGYKPHWVFLQKTCKHDDCSEIVKVLKENNNVNSISSSKIILEN